MDLDFSKCKTKEDVEKVFRKKEQEIMSLKDFKHNLFAQDQLKELNEPKARRRIKCINKI